MLPVSMLFGWSQVLAASGDVKADDVFATARRFRRGHGMDIPGLQLNRLKARVTQCEPFCCCFAERIRMLDLSR